MLKVGKCYRLLNIDHKTRKKYYSTIRLVDGFHTNPDNGRVSNFWYWRVYQDNGLWSEQLHCGYGGDWEEVEDPTLEIQREALNKLTNQEKNALGLSLA